MDFHLASMFTVNETGKRRSKKLRDLFRAAF